MRKISRLTSVVLALALTFSVFGVAIESNAAKSKAMPKLSKTKLTIIQGKTKSVSITGVKKSQLRSVSVTADSAVLKVKKKAINSYKITARKTTPADTYLVKFVIKLKNNRKYSKILNVNVKEATVEEDEDVVPSVNKEYIETEGMIYADNYTDSHYLCKVKIKGFATDVSFPLMANDRYQLGILDGQTLPLTVEDIGYDAEKRVEYTSSDSDISTQLGYNDKDPAGVYSAMLIKNNTSDTINITDIFIRAKKDGAVVALVHYPVSITLAAGAQNTFKKSLTYHMKGTDKIIDSGYGSYEDLVAGTAAADYEIIVGLS